MTNIQSNSQESSLKTRIRELTTTYVANELITYIDKLVVDNHLDYEKLSLGILTAISGAEMSNPNGYIRKVAYDMAINNTEKYKKNRVQITLNEMFEDMKKLGFTGEDWEKIYIEYIEEHCLNEFPVSVEEMTKTNHAIIDYCKSKDLFTYDKFIKLLLASRVCLKCQIPTSTFEKQAKKEVEEIEEGLKKLNALSRKV